MSDGSQATRGSLDAREQARVQAMQDMLLPGVFQYARLVETIFITVMGWLAVTLEVFSRHRFGERYLTPYRVGIGAFLFGVYALITGGIDVVGYMAVLDAVPELTFQQAYRAFPWNALLLGVFFLAYLLMGLYHQFEVYYRNHFLLDPWHSHSFGVPWGLARLRGRKVSGLPLPAIDDWFLYTTLEPWCWLLVASALLIISPAFTAVHLLGQWLFIGSLALFMKNQLIYKQSRDEELNIIDAQIELAARRLSAQGAPIEQTAGYKVVELPRAMDQNRDGTPDRLTEDDIMRRFMKTAVPPSGNGHGAGQGGQS